MPCIVISYRRDDTAWITGRISDRLKDYYEPKRHNVRNKQVVFMDYDNMRLGVDFRVQIKEIMNKCDVVLAIIGPKWLGNDGTGNCKIMQNNDWVRIELETALRNNITILPVLIDDTAMPTEAFLPTELHNLTYIHAAKIDSQIDFNAHIDRLIREIDRHLGKEGAPPKPQWWRYLLLAVAVGAGAVTMVTVWRGSWLVPSYPQPVYTVYMSPDLDATIIYPNNILTLDNTERDKHRLALKDSNGKPLVLISRTPLEKTDVKQAKKTKSQHCAKCIMT